MAATREEMQELVNDHAALADDPMDTAIWIRPGERDAWLVEVVPSFPEDDHPERPVEFNPGETFRYPLNLVAGNRSNIERALRADQALAKAVAEGMILYGDVVGREIQALAASVSADA